MTVTLPPELQEYVNKRVASGRSPTADAVLADALRALQQLEQSEAKRSALVADLEEAEAEIAAGKVIRGPINARQMLEEIRRGRAQS